MSLRAIGHFVVHVLKLLPYIKNCLLLRLVSRETTVLIWWDA